jgi:hypothetical protein
MPYGNVVFKPRLFPLHPGYVMTVCALVRTARMTPTRRYIADAIVMLFEYSDVSEECKLQFEAYVAQQIASPPLALRHGMGTKLLR